MERHELGLDSEKDCRGTPCRSCTANEEEIAEFVEVVCLVLPTGENLWFEAAKGRDYMCQVIDKWKGEHPEFLNTPCNMGAVHITMPSEKYIAIGAHLGPRCFVWT